MKRPTLVLFDAHAILHRAFHAIPDFTTKNGEPTGALYGLSTLILKTINTFHPEDMVACFDLPKPTFRDKVYSAYKGKRPDVDEALVAQIIRARDVFAAFGIPTLDAEGFEADDVIGTLSSQAKKTHDVLIVTGDMDTLQLVDEKRVRVFTLKKGITDTVIYDEEKVKERYGFGPEHVPDYKGLRGDPSDNIIGIHGIGEKTATALILAFGSIEHMYEVLKKKDGEAMFAKAGISPRLIELIRDHEEDALFSKMLATIRCDAPVSVDLSKTHRERYDVEQVKKLFSELEFRSLIQRLGGTSSDESTTSEKQHTKHEAIAFPTTPELWEKAKIALGLLDTELSNPSHEDFAAVEGNTPEEKLAHLEKQIDAAKLTKVYRDIELPLIPILRAASNKGILIDREHFLQLSKEYHHELSKAMKEVYRHAGEEFNINSPKQLGIILFDKLALTAKGLKKTEGGARSTRESELEKLRDSHPIIDAVLRYREYQKLLSTYVDAIPTLADKEGRVHTTFHQLGAATGRMATSDPGLQNIPVRDGVGERIRDGFTVPKGKTLLAFDYSQIEMRVLAILSRDEGLLEIFKHEQDVHTSVAARVFKVRAEDVTKDMRRRAKVINFGIIYGMGVSALQRSLGGTRAEAQAFYDDYLGAFPRAAAFLEQTIADAKRLGYTTTLFGRRRSLRDLRSKIPFVRAAAERAAMNAPIQGTAADLVKIAMKHADDALSKTELHGSATFLLQVHDELIYEVDENKDVIMQVVRSIKHACEGVYPNSPIPLSVTTKIGKRWGSMKEYPAQSH